MMTVLANNAELLIWAVLVLIGITSTIVQALKKKEGHQGSPPRLEPVEEDDAPRVSLDELAAHRRAELAAEAQRRRAAGQAQAGPPRPLSMAERMQRAREQAMARASAAQQRIEQLRRGEADAQQQRAQQVELERRRQAALRQQQQQQRQRAQRRTPQQQPPPRPSQRPPTPRRAPAPPPPHQPHDARQHGQVHTPPPAASPAAQPAAPATIRLPRLPLREAMIWKEILDKPVGLRGTDYDFPT